MTENDQLSSKWTETRSAEKLKNLKSEFAKQLASAQRHSNSESAVAAQYSNCDNSFDKKHLSSESNAALPPSVYEHSCEQLQSNTESNVAGQPSNCDINFAAQPSSCGHVSSKMHSIADEVVLPPFHGGHGSDNVRSSGDCEPAKEQGSGETASGEVGESELREIKSAAEMMADASLKIAIAASMVGFKELQLLFTQTAALMKRAEEVASRDVREILASDARKVLPAEITWTFHDERREAKSEEQSSSSA